MHRSTFLSLLGLLSLAFLFTARVSAQFTQPSMPSRHDLGTPPYKISASSLLGDGSDGNHVSVSAVLGDGSILVGGHMGKLPFVKNATAVDGATPSSPWLLLRLTGDGRRVLGALRFPSPISDLVVDGREGVYIAAGDSGMFAYTPRLDRQVYHHDNIGFAARVDAGPTGFHAVLSPSKGKGSTSKSGSGRIRVYDPSGKEIQKFRGHRNTMDLAVDEANRAVLFTGWRQARSWQPDGGGRLPVQISYIRSVGFNGQTRWTGYDWSTRRGEKDFINNGDNNMADSRGYRCTVGPNGKLYVGFEVAGGNHIFRYSPGDITRRVTGKFAGGNDKYHQFYNTRSEHKLFLGVYEPRDGSFVTGKQFTARLSNGRGNAWRIKEGEIDVAENGQIWIAAYSAAGVPFTFVPETAPGYKGGAVLHAMSPDLTNRDYGIYLGAGKSHTVAARVVPGKPTPVVVFGGESPPLRKSTAEYILQHYPLQSGRNGKTNGFFKVLNGRGGQQ